VVDPDYKDINPNAGVSTVVIIISEINCNLLVVVPMIFMTIDLRIFTLIINCLCGVQHLIYV
jgi:hypothetical protein